MTDGHAAHAGGAGVRRQAHLELLPGKAGSWRRVPLDRDEAYECGVDDVLQMLGWYEAEPGVWRDPRHRSRNISIEFEDVAEDVG